MVCVCGADEKTEGPEVGQRMRASTKPPEKGRKGGEAEGSETKRRAKDKRMTLNCGKRGKAQ